MIKIYGAGMAGLLAANMLRRFSPVVYEIQPSLPNNHEALLRFRSDAISRATHIPFRKVTVEKAIVMGGRFYGHPTIQMNNLYSLKVTGRYRARSISDLRSAERYIAPNDFVAQLARGLDIHYNEGLALLEDKEEPRISTIPMPAMMDMAQWSRRPEFPYRSVWSLTLDLDDTDLYQTIYYPDHNVDYYRVSITGSRMIAEYTKPPLSWAMDARRWFLDFGIIGKDLSSAIISKRHEYGKLSEINNDERRNFILALTDNWNIYSLGRFSTWRQILLDDLVQDIKRIESWVTDRDAYRRRMEAK